MTQRSRFSQFRRACIAACFPLAALGTTAVESGAQTEGFETYAADASLAGDHADVFRLYWSFFDRQPDVGGARYWVEQYNGCASLLDITWSFGNSDEFNRRYSNLDHEQYVRLVYNNVLDREPDWEGEAYWRELLNSGELIQSEVMLYFALSDEFKARHPLPSDGRPFGGCVDPEPDPDPVYANCDAVRAAGAAPIRRGDPGYRSGLDRDNDGIGCE